MFSFSFEDLVYIRGVEKAALGDGFVKGVSRRCLKDESLREDLEFISHAILHPPGRIVTNHFKGRF